MVPHLVVDFISIDVRGYAHWKSAAGGTLSVLVRRELHAERVTLTTARSSNTMRAWANSDFATTWPASSGFKNFRSEDVRKTQRP